MNLPSVLDKMSVFFPICQQLTAEHVKQLENIVDRKIPPCPSLKIDENIFSEKLQIIIETKNILHQCNSLMAFTDVDKSHELLWCEMTETHEGEPITTDVLQKLSDKLVNYRETFRNLITSNISVKGHSSMVDCYLAFGIEIFGLVGCIQNYETYMEYLYIAYKQYLFAKLVYRFMVLLGQYNKCEPGESESDNRVIADEKNSAVSVSRILDAYEDSIDAHYESLNQSSNGYMENLQPDDGYMENLQPDEFVEEPEDRVNGDDQDDEEPEEDEDDG